MNINAPDYPSQHFSSQSPANHRVTSAAIRVSVLSDANWLPIEEEPLELGPDDEVAPEDEAEAFLSNLTVRDVLRAHTPSLQAWDAFEMVEMALGIVGPEGVLEYVNRRDWYGERITSDGREHNQMPERANG